MIQPFMQPGIKQRDLLPCILCKRGVMHDQQMTSFRVRSAYMCANLPAVQRQHGLEMTLNGHADIAMVMGPNEDLLITAGNGYEISVCLDCAMRATLWEIHEACVQCEEAQETKT